MPSDDMIDSFIESLNPIQLPSDEEVEYVATQMPMNTFELGAKWMRDKIQGGNK